MSSTSSRDVRSSSSFTPTTWRGRWQRSASKQQGYLVFHFQNRYRCADGSYRWLEWTSHPDYDAGLMYAVARDITERKQAEEIVAGQRALLEEMVDARTAELEEARWETLRCLALAAEYRD